MEHINIKKSLSELRRLGATTLQRETVLNNIRQYNDLVDLYEEGDKKGGYLMYQLNVQIFKSIESLKKVKAITTDNEKDPLLDLVKTLKKK